MNRYLIDILLVVGILIVMALVMVIVVVIVKSNKGDSDEDEVDDTGDEPTSDDTGDVEPTSDDTGDIEPISDDTGDEPISDDTGDVEPTYEDPTYDDTGDVESEDDSTEQYDLDSYGNLTFTPYATLKTLTTPIKELFPDNYRSIQSIDYTNIKSDIMIPTDNETYSLENLYNWCSSLIYITFGNNFNTEYVNNMAKMFYYCKSLVSLDLSSFNTYNVTIMYNMFNNCVSLTGIDLRSFDTSNVKNMSAMFNACESLTYITFGSTFYTNNVSDMSSMFKQCSSLTSLDLSGFNTSGVSNMSCLFEDCYNLSLIDIHSLTHDNNPITQYMFTHMSSTPNVDEDGEITSYTSNKWTMYISYDFLDYLVETKNMLKDASNLLSNYTNTSYTLIVTCKGSQINSITTEESND